jgi:hypothetical protein
MVTLSTRSFRIVLALSCTALAFSSPAAAAESATPGGIPANGRFVVGGIESTADLSENASQAQDSLKDELRKRTSIQVLSYDALDRALEEARAQHPGCSGDACVIAAARLLHADVLVAGSLTRDGKAWVLTVSATSLSSGNPVKTSERMRHLKNVPMNVQLCLDRLLTEPAPVAAPKESPRPVHVAAPIPLAADPDAGIVHVAALDRHKIVAKPMPTPAPVTAPVAIARVQERDRRPEPLPEATPADEVPPAPAVKPVAEPPQRHPRAEMPLIAVLTPKAGPGFRPKDLASIEDMLLSALDGTKQLRLVTHANDQTLLDVLAGSMAVDYIAAPEVARLDRGTVMTLRLIDVRRSTVVVHARQLAETNADLGAAADDVAGQAIEAILGNVAAGHTARADNDHR